MGTRTWWELGVALAVAGGAFAFHRFESRKREPIQWPAGKNFGAFPPDIPGSLFDDVSFL